MDNLEERLQRLEQRISELENRIEQTTPVASSSLSSTSSKQIESVLIPPPFVPPQQEVVEIFSLNEWFKANWILCCGLFFVILASSWFISYAFANILFAPIVRLAACFLLGIGLYTAGLFKVKKAPQLSQILVLLGATLSIMSVYTSYQTYQFFPALLTFICLFLITGITISIALYFNLEILGLLSILTLMAIPSLIYENNLSALYLLCYILLLDCATLLMYCMRGWGRAFHMAWFGTIIASSAFYGLENILLIYLFIIIFYLLFFIPAVLSACYLSLKQLPLKGNVILFSANLLLSIWISNHANLPYDFILYLCAALLSFYYGVILNKNWKSTTKDNLLHQDFTAFILAGSVMFFFSLAFHTFIKTYQLNFEVLLYLLQTVFAMYLAYTYFKAPKLTKYLAFYFTIPIYSIWNNYPNILYSSFLSLNFLNLFMAFLTFFYATYLVYKSHDQSATLIESKILTFLSVLSAIFGMSLIWNINNNLFENVNLARALSLITYIIGAEIFIYLGNLYEAKNLRFAGILIILFVILRLLFVEIWSMSLAIRTLTFFIVGFLLIGTAWFDKKVSQLNKGEKTL